MKKIVLVIFLIGVLFMLCSCSDEPIRSNNGTILIKETFIEETIIPEKFIREKVITEKTWENSVQTWDDV